MKRFTILLVIAAFFAVSCEKNDEFARNNEVQEETRAAGNLYEPTIIAETPTNSQGLAAQLLRMPTDPKGVFRVYYKFNNPNFIKPAHSLIMYYNTGNISYHVVYYAADYDKDLKCYFFSFPTAFYPFDEWVIDFVMSDMSAPDDNKRETNARFVIDIPTYNTMQAMPQIII